MYLFQPLELTVFFMVSLDFKQGKGLQQIAPESGIFPFDVIYQVGLPSKEISVGVHNGTAFPVPDMMQDNASCGMQHNDQIITSMINLLPKAW
jgi:hypothetical protein